LLRSSAAIVARLHAELTGVVWADAEPCTGMTNAAAVIATSRDEPS
jgi:hypothetical protein